MAELIQATLHAGRLARYLRELRDAADMTPREVCTALNCSVAKIYRIEKAKSGVTPDFVTDLLDLYKVHGTRRDKLLKLAEEARQPAWWTAYKGIFKSRYVVLEQDATGVCEWGPILIPGLLQTEDYARAVIHVGRPELTEAEVNLRAAARMRRQGLLTGDDPAALHVVLDEAALLRPVGGQAVMDEQLRALLRWADLPNVTIQVLPLDIGAHAGMEGTFIILRFGDDDPEAAYVENMGEDRYLEDEKVVNRCKEAFGRLCGAAAPKEKSMAIISKRLSGFTP